MSERLNFYTIEGNYYEYLRKYENRLMISTDNKARRPFIGIVLKVNGAQYCAPLSSPKPKHLKMKNSMDFLKIDNGNYGAINFNNMFPVYKNVLDKIELKSLPISTTEDRQYKNLLENQLSWCNANSETILKRAATLYKQMMNKPPENLCQRCCDFLLLEQKMKEYIQNKNQPLSGN